MNSTLRVLCGVGLAAVAGGCARFPNSSANQFTKITFNITMSAPINPNYLYYLVMYASTDPSPVPSTVDPLPTLAYGAPNGFFTGAATNYVLMQPNNLARPCSIYQVTSPSNPGVTPDNLTGSTNDQITLDSQGNYPSTWTVTLYTSYLAPGNATLAQQFKSLTFQIITMNKLAIGTGTGVPSGRIVDAIGPGTNFEPLTIRTDYSNTASNSSFGSVEPANDTIGGNDPSLDIIDFNVQVATP